MSLPSRGAWIEIAARCRSRPAGCVAPLAGSVDRNDAVPGAVLGDGPVAPLAGSVDRNGRIRTGAAQPGLVAPLAGSVDRNDETPNQAQMLQAVSLPSRGAWIEMVW